MAKKDDLDAETLALIEWCTQVETFLVAAGASLVEAQNYIDEQAEWFTVSFTTGSHHKKLPKHLLMSHKVP